MRGPNDVDLPATTLHLGHDGLKHEVTDKLCAGGHHVCGVEVVPDVVDFSYCHPVVPFVAYEALLSRQIAKVLVLSKHWSAGKPAKRFQSFRENLDVVVAIQGYICGLEFLCISLEQHCFLLIKLLCNLTQGHLIKNWPLKYCINAV